MQSGMFAATYLSHPFPTPKSGLRKGRAGRAALGAGQGYGGFGGDGDYCFIRGYSV